METYEAVLKRRAIRQFKPDRIDNEILQKIADAGRLAPSAMNMQPLHFLIVDNPDLNSKIFDSLKWAGYLTDWTPPKDKQPTAYIFVLVDSGIKKTAYEYDVGLAAENMMIVATAFDLGSCCLAVVDKKGTADILNIPDRYILTLVVALGYPAEKSQTDEVKESVRYFRDEGGVMHVPKRKSSRIIHFNRM